MNNNDMFEIQCSDDESYFEPGIVYREVNGKRIWEPKGDVIAELYSKLESNGGCFHDEEFDWKNPGRISPSKLEKAKNVESLGNNDTVINSEKNNSIEKEIKTEFDFDNDFDDDNTALDTNATVTVKNRSNQSLKKSTTDLSALVRNIKKYQQ